MDVVFWITLECDLDLGFHWTSSALALQAQVGHVATDNQH